MIEQAVAELTAYACRTGLIETCDCVWAANRLLAGLGLPGTETFGEAPPAESRPLEDILRNILDWAASNGRIENTVTARDLLDTELMGRLTPRPSQVAQCFAEKYARSPREATDWYYQFSQDCDYIRRYRIKKDMKWTAPTPYGELDITINLSKPEKDPRAIAAALSAAPNSYPACQLCRENEGYAGRPDHPARQNLRLIPLKLDGQDWFLQYSPYVYYNEHCIVLNRSHTPMGIDRGALRRLLDFVAQFPHYFVGSNADLPIVGGSILTHDHFQGGRYVFPMARAAVAQAVSFPGFSDVEAGIVHWPMSVLRLRSSRPNRLEELGDRILRCWREYSDPSADILAESGGAPHNTITPIARMREGKFELDLVLRNNRATAEHPLGIFHPHQELHHIKKENIGLIEVMGLAVLPSRLKDELAALAGILADGGDPSSDPLTEKHAVWAESLRARWDFNRDNALPILQKEVGAVFGTVLEHAGVYKHTEPGQAAFARFVRSVK